MMVALSAVQSIMPALDRYPVAAKAALIKDGWVILMVFNAEQEVITLWKS
jgi:hypothetical protein